MAWGSQVTGPFQRARISPVSCPATATDSEKTAASVVDVMQEKRTATAPATRHCTRSRAVAAARGPAKRAAPPPSRASSAARSNAIPARFRASTAASPR